MILTDQFNETVAREISRLTPGQANHVVDAMEQFDSLVKLGLVQPEPYKVEAIGTMGMLRAPALR